jgi:hypothetical protein
MSQSTNKPVGDRRAVADSRGIQHNATDAEHDEFQVGLIDSGDWLWATSRGIPVNLCSSAPGVEANASGSALHDVLEKIEALNRTALCGVEPLLTGGAGI